MSNNPTYADLTASELMYLADQGFESAAECLRGRARKGEMEAVHYLTNMSGDVDEEYMADEQGQYYYPEMQGEACCNSCTNGGTCGDELLGDELVMGDGTAPTPLDFLMPHRLLDKAIDSAAARVAPQMTRPVVAPRQMIRPPMPIRRPMLPLRPRLPQWGVFMDYQQQPVEVFDTLDAANAYAQGTASQFPAGFPLFVVHAGQEPPRAPYGYVSQLQPETPTPYSSYDYAQDISSGTRAPSAYEAYQLAQGQRI